MTRPAERPVLITDVGESPQEEYARRRRRYGAMMAGRVVCVIAAFVVGSLFHAIWLAFACIVGAAVLPWAAVLIANDRLPKAERARIAERRAAAPRGTATATALPRAVPTPGSSAPGSSGSAGTPAAARTTAGDPDGPARPPRIIEG